MSSGISNLKAKGPCQCELGTCELFGTLGRPDRKGRSHVRGCACNVCRGRRNKRKGGERQSRAAKALGIPHAGAMRPGNEEHWGGAVRTECKSGAQVKPIHTRFVGAHMQSEQNRPFGDNRPFVFTAYPDGVKHGYVIIRDDHLEAAVAALAEQFGMFS